jgi:hypothetical protein
MFLTHTRTAVGKHQLPGYRATRANFAFRPACGTYL